MARIIEGQAGKYVYHDVVAMVRSYGRRRSSRNGSVYEVPNLTIVLESPVDALPIGCGRNVNTKIAAAEALQLIGGFSNPDLMCRIAPQFDRYREDIVESDLGNGENGGFADVKRRVFWGAYGDRIGAQLASVIRKLKDQSTRQAVITLWDPKLDNEPNHLDYPCTIGLGFTIYKDSLEMNVTMRSNDVWLGLPYDMFQFGQLQLTLCNVLGLQPGTYTHTAWSMHLYGHDLEKTYELTSDVDEDSYLLAQPDGLGEFGTPVEHLWTVARIIAREPHRRSDLWKPTTSEEWYIATLSGQISS